MCDWFSASELAGKPGLPNGPSGVIKKARRESWASQDRLGPGGGKEYHVESLPEITQKYLRYNAELPSDSSCAPVATKNESASAAPANGGVPTRETAWKRYEARPDKERAVADHRARLCREVHALIERGEAQSTALQLVGYRYDESPRTIEGWYVGRPGRPGLKHLPIEDWNAYAMPQWRGRKKEPCTPEAWDMMVRLHLDDKAKKPTSFWYRQVADAAKKEGWIWPSERTVTRWVKELIPEGVRRKYREGADAVEDMYPWIVRTVEGMHSLEVVNGDGVLFKDYVLWPDGSVARPTAWFWQDVFSRRLLVWDLDQSENKDVIRRSIHSLITRYGLPDEAQTDNTTAAASKEITAGEFNRWRWKKKAGDVDGLLPELGIKHHATKPGHGQSKPVERAFRDVRVAVDRNPRFGNRGTKANPVPLEQFVEVLEDAVAEHNARPGRRTEMAEGKHSFDEVFNASYQKSVIRQPTPEQVRIATLTTKVVNYPKRGGPLFFGEGKRKNGYWCDELADHTGETLKVRYDHRDLHKAVYVYTADGRFIGEAECRHKVGYRDQQTARAQLRDKTRFTKAQKEQGEILKRMDRRDAVRLLPRHQQGDLPAPGATQIDFRSNRAVGDDLVGDDEAMRPKSGISDEQRRQMENNAAKKIARLQRARRNEL